MSGVDVLIVADPDVATRYWEWLPEEHKAGICSTREEAETQLDHDVDLVVVHAMRFVDALVEHVRVEGLNCSFAVLSEENKQVSGVDAIVEPPEDPESLRQLIDDFDRRGDIDEAIERYYRLVARKRALERTADQQGDSDREYRQLLGEISARRSQISTLLQRHADPERKEEADALPEPPAFHRAQPIKFLSLWFLALLTYGIGDVVSTGYAVMQVPGLVEGNPVVDTILVNFGFSGFLLLKLLVFLFLLSVSLQGSEARDRFSYYWPPVLTILLGTGLTAWNLWLIYGAL